MPTKSLLSRPAAHILLVAVIGLAAYANTFHVPFFLDDEGSIVNNLVIRNLEGFLSGAGYDYNPRRFLGYLSFALNYRFGGVDVTGYHVVNLCIHLLSATLVYWLARLTLRTPFLAAGDEATARVLQCVPLTAALLFVAHPVQTQAVTYVVQRLSSLAALFYLLSVASYAKARLLREEAGKRSLAACAFFYLVALLSAGCAMKTKEIAFTLPFVIALYEFLFFRMTLAKKLLFMLPLALTVMVVPLSLLGTGKPLGELLSDVTAVTRVSGEISRLDYLFTQFPVLATYLRLIFLPIGQNLDYDFPLYRSLQSGPVLSSLLLLAALALFACYLLRKSREKRELRLISFGIFWFFITLAVESSLIPIPDLIFEHRLYLPSAGLLIAVAAALSMLFARVPRAVASFALGLVVLLLAGGTYLRNEVWRSDVSLWSDVVGKSPKKARPRYNLALALSARGRLDEALLQAGEAIRLSPAEANAYNLVGSILGRKGDFDGAIAAFEQALRLDPLQAGARVNLGDACRLKGDQAQAMEEYQAALRLSPGSADIYHKIGALYAMQGDMAKAAVFYQCAASLDPSRPEYRRDLLRAGSGAQ